MQEGLLRQRRNLFVTSCILWLLKAAEVQVKKYSLAGFDIDVQNPRVLYVALWIAFGYFFYRYYQYFVAEGLPKLTEAFHAALEAKTSRFIRSQVRRVRPDVDPSLKFSFKLVKERKWTYAARMPNKDPTGVTLSMDAVEVPVRPWSLWPGVLLALAELTFRSSVVTDYLLPFLVGVGVLWYCGQNDWPGGLMSLLFT